MRRTVTIAVPAHVILSLLIGLCLWVITGDGVWAYGYTCGAIFPVLIKALERSPEHRDEP